MGGHRIVAGHHVHVEDRGVAESHLDADHLASVVGPSRLHRANPVHVGALAPLEDDHGDPADRVDPSLALLVLYIS